MDYCCIFLTVYLQLWLWMDRITPLGKLLGHGKYKLWPIEPRIWIQHTCTWWSRHELCISLGQGSFSSSVWSWIYEDCFAVSFCLSLMWLWHQHSICSALACLPDDLKEKLVSKVEARDRFQNLYESVHSISSKDALKLFHDDILRSGSEQLQNKGNVDVEIVEGDISECNQLGRFSRELDCLLHECPSVELHAAVDRQTVGWLPLPQRQLFWSDHNKYYFEEKILLLVQGVTVLWLCLSLELYW